MDPKLLERINALARKQKESPLTEEEKAEQAALRAEYIKEYRIVLIIFFFFCLTPKAFCVEV